MSLLDAIDGILRLLGGLDWLGQLLGVGLREKPPVGTVEFDDERLWLNKASVEFSHELIGIRWERVVGATLPPPEDPSAMLTIANDEFPCDIQVLGKADGHEELIAELQRRDLVWEAS